MVAAMTRTSASTVCGAADALEPPLLQHAEQFRLHGQRDLADLVEEDGAAVGQLEPPLALADGAGERPLLVAEQLALQQRLGQRRAVHRDERVATPGRRVVDRPRHQLLARAGLAEDQHRADRLRHVADQLEDVVHPRALAQDGVERELLVQLLAQLRHLVLQRPLAQGALDHQPEVLQVDRLGEEVDGPQPHRLHGLLDGAEARGDDHVGRQPALLHLLEQLQAVDPRHLQVGDDHAVGALGQRLQRVAAVGRGIHREAGVGLEEHLDLLAGRLVVLDDQDASPGRGRRPGLDRWRFRGRSLGARRGRLVAGHASSPLWDPAGLPQVDANLAYYTCAETHLQPKLGAARPRREPGRPIAPAVDATPRTCGPDGRRPTPQGLAIRQLRSWDRIRTEYGAIEIAPRQGRPSHSPGSAVASPPSRPSNRSL